jgi:site-specific recombinase XerD
MATDLIRKPSRISVSVMDGELRRVSDARTRQAYKTAIEEFCTFINLTESAQLRSVSRTHVISWCKDLEALGQRPSSVHSKLSALYSLFKFLCERDLVPRNPVNGVKRATVKRNSRSKPGLNVVQARKLLDAPSRETIKGLRDRAILATLLCHCISRRELCKLRVGDIQIRDGIEYFHIVSNRGKPRFVPVHAEARRLIVKYLGVAKHAGELHGPLFRPVRNNRTGVLNKHLDPGAVYRNIVRKYGRKTGINAEVVGFCVDVFRDSSGTSAHSQDAEIAKLAE